MTSPKSPGVRLGLSTCVARSFRFGAPFLSVLRFLRESILSKVYFVGAGPGDPELITVKGLRIIQEADLVLYAGSLVPAEIASKAKPSARVVDSAPLNLEETHRLLVETVAQGGIAARVHTGDPSLYGAVREQARLLDREGIPYEVIPGVTAAFAVAAKAAVSFTVPGESQSLIITRTAGKTGAPESERLRDMAKHRCSLAIYLSAAEPEVLQNELLDGGLEEDTLVVIGHRVGWPGEQLAVTRLKDMAAFVRENEIHRQALFLILPGEDDRDHYSKLYSPRFTHGYRRATPTDGLPEDDPVSEG